MNDGGYMQPGRHLARRLLMIVSSLLLTEISPHSAIAAEKVSGNEDLIAISAFVQEICPAPPMKGTETTTELSGSLEAKLDAFIKRMKGLGIEGAAKYGNSEYMGVLRKDLAQSLKEASNCRQAVFDKLLERLLPIPQPKSQGASSSSGPQKPHPPIATLAIEKIERAGQEIRIHILLNNLSKEDHAYFTKLRVFSVCPLEKPTDCKIGKQRNSYWEKVGKLNYTELPSIKIGNTHKQSGEILSSEYIAIEPGKQEGYFFLMSQDTSQDLIAKLAYEYRMGPRVVRMESAEIMAIKYGGIRPSQPPTLNMELLLTSDLEMARLFVVDPSTYELKRGQRL